MTSIYKFVCIKCGLTGASIGQHVENYKDDMTQYVCLVCKTKEKK
jgi:hypothetical protein